MSHRFHAALGVAAAAMLACSLSACAGSESAPAIASGTVSDAIAVQDFSAPSISPQPDAKVDVGQLTVHTHGDGPQVSADGAVTLTLGFFNASTGDQLGTTEGSGTTALEPSTLLVSSLTSADSEGSGGMFSQLHDALLSMRSGDAFTLVVPNVQIQQGEDAVTVALVGQVNDAFPARATGSEVSIPAGFPQLVLDTDGRPGLVIPDGYQDPENAPQSALTRRGSGAELQDGQQATIQFVVFDTSTKQVQSSTWEQGQLSSYTIGAADGDQAAAIDQALQGQTVGSQILVRIPSASGTGNANIAVIDILAASDPADTGADSGAGSGDGQ